MMNDKELTNKMLKEGFNVANSGFHYIKEAMKLFDEEGLTLKTEALYSIVASRYEKSSISVERSIRHEIQRYYENHANNIPVALQPTNGKTYLPSREFLRRLYVYLNYTVRDNE